ncbi:sporulation killing factor system integral membrane protein [Bacillus sp. Bos-x628]|uniref:sporulation killing factor system integral membrane protein n=1 Tax=Bacillus maqinnsis TaxID=3229854 RepID=UPI00338DBF10
MNNTISLLWTKSKRRFISKNQEKKMPLLILLLLVGAIGFQLSAVLSMGSWDSSVAGWMIVFLFILYTGFGLFSNRLPSQMNDIIWLYGNGASLWTVVMSVWMYHIFWRSALLIVSAIFTDFLIFFFTQQYPFLLGKSLILTGMLLMVETWMIAVSSARTIKAYKRIYLFIFLMMFGCYLLLFLSRFILQRFSFLSEADSFMNHVGRMFETVSLLYLFIFLGVMALSLVTIYLACNRLEMKESLVKEAEFWEEFEGKQIHSNQMLQKKSNTWWGGKKLTGNWAFLWLELLLIRKYITFHFLSTMLLIGLFYVVLSFFSEWLILFNVIILASVMLSSYYAGIVRHAQTGVLYLFPGALYQKILILEGFQTIWLYIVYFISLLFNEVVDLFYWSMYGVGLYIWFLATRLFAFTQPLRREARLSMVVYYRSLFIAVVISALSLIGIHAFTDGWYTTITFIIIGLLYCAVCYRFRATN